MESAFSNMSVDVAVKAAEVALSECELVTDPFEAESLAWIADKCATRAKAEAEVASTTAAHALYGYRRACERVWQAAGCREACYHSPDNKAAKACAEHAWSIAEQAQKAREFAALTRATANRVREAADGTAAVIDLEAALAFEEAFEKAKQTAALCLMDESIIGPRSQEYSAKLALLAEARVAAANSEDLKALNLVRAAMEKRILDAAQGPNETEALQ